MSDDGKSDKNGFRIDTKGISCIPCRCKRQFYHKETKTTTENNVTTTNTIEDRRNMKFGGRNVSPDEIFKPENVLQSGSVEICDNGWGSKGVTPEELEERVDKLETSVEEIKKDVEEVKLQKVIISL